MGPAVWPAIRITQHIYIYETSCFIILIVNIVNVYMLPLQVLPESIDISPGIASVDLCRKTHFKMQYIMLIDVLKSQN